MRRLTSVLPIIALAMLQPACFVRGVVETLSGFRVRAVVVPTLGGGTAGQPAPAPFAHVTGQHRGDLPGGISIGWRMFYAQPTDGNGRTTIAGGRTQAYWEHRGAFDGQMSPTQIDLVFQAQTLVDRIPKRPGSLAPSTARFAVAGWGPSEFTVGGTGISGAHCAPQLDVYGQDDAVVFTASATAVAGDGSSATFPFPHKADGSPLDPHMYAMAVINCDSPDQDYCDPVYDDYGSIIDWICYTIPGEKRAAGYNFTTVGSAQAIGAGPHGVDVADDNVEVQECTQVWVDDDCQFSALLSCGRWELECNDWSYTDSRPAFTLRDGAQILYDGSVVGVGDTPTAVKVYGPVTTISQWGSPVSTFHREIHTRPGKAAVLNAGSGSLSIVNLITREVEATVPVGSQPTALAVSADGQTAYVANGGGESVTKVDLASNAAVLTSGVGGPPTALTLAVDGGVWVGGAGWVKRLDPGSLQVTQEGGVGGTITGMDYSDGQSLLFLSLVSGDSAAPSAFGASKEPAQVIHSVRALSATDLSTVTESVTGPASPYAKSAAARATALTGSGLMGDAVAVSVQLANGLGVSSRPGGFLVVDLADGGAELMRGDTPCPVRGIAAGSSEKMLYLTLPDCNTVVSVPLP